MDDCTRKAFAGCRGDGGETCKDCPSTLYAKLLKPVPETTPHTFGQFIALVLMISAIAFVGFYSLNNMDRDYAVQESAQ